MLPKILLLTSIEYESTVRTNVEIMFCIGNGEPSGRGSCLVYRFWKAGHIDKARTFAATVERMYRTPSEAVQHIDASLDIRIAGANTLTSKKRTLVYRRDDAPDRSGLA